MNKDEKREAKLREKNRKEQEKLELKRQKEMRKEEKERIKNSFGYKFKSFIFTVIFVMILIVVAFFGLKYYLNEKETELYNEEMSYYFEQGEKFLNEKKFEEAINMFNKVEEDSEIYDKTQEKLKETLDSYLEEYKNTADIYVSAGEFDRAIDLFNSLPDALKDTDEVKEEIANIELLKVQSKIESMTNLYDVLVTISESIEPDLSQEAKDKITEFLNAKISDYETEVKDNISSETYEKYLKEAEELVKIYPEDVKIAELLELVKSYQPKNLLSLSYQNENETIDISNDKGSVTDNKNAKYTSYILVKETDELKENAITWNLDGNYSELSGKICLSNKIKDVKSDGVKVTILGDNKVIYKSKKIKKGTNPFNFNIDVTGVKELKLILESDNDISYFIANPTINK